jgi:hypothetical protein
MPQASTPTNIEPINGATVVLRGRAVEVDSDVGQAFTADCVRFIEGIVTEEQLRKKYDLDDDSWRQLASHDALQRAGDDLGPAKPDVPASPDALRPNVCVPTPWRSGGSHGDRTIRGRLVPQCSTGRRRCSTPRTLRHRKTSQPCPLNRSGDGSAEAKPHPGPTPSNPKTRCDIFIAPRFFGHHQSHPFKPPKSTNVVMS